jgi:uncharacterized protein (DUF1501 family)
VIATTTTTDPFRSGDCGCPGREITRRGLLRAATLAGMTAVFGSAVVTMGLDVPATGAVGRGRSVVVVVSLRGAADGLSLLVPHGDPAYYRARPAISIPADRLVARDEFFGLHPAMAPLVPLWKSGRLAGVHATGLAIPNRSHFSAMEELENADPGSSTRVGWLNRMVGSASTGSRIQGVVLGSSLPTSMIGPEPVMSFADLESAHVTGANVRTARGRARLRALRAQWNDSRTPMGMAVREALGAVVDLEPAKREEDRRRWYPEGDLGAALSAVARTIRADIGVTAVTVDSGDWDMHVGLGSHGGGWMARNAAELAAAVAAFFRDLGDAADRVTLITVSEFGRRVQENANGGLDHGWGNVMLLAGAGVNGGRYYGSWTGLSVGLDDDVPVTTDYRSVLAEVVAARTDASTAEVFPGFQRERVGVMSGQ